MLNENNKILITGAFGMLAGDFIPLVLKANMNSALCDLHSGTLLGTPVQVLDICDASAVKGFVEDFKPKWIVNLAAFTAVDASEHHTKQAYAVNAGGPANLASAAKTVGAKLAHISTDYVFGSNIKYGKRAEAFKENAVTNPCGVYGKSKLYGEKLIKEILPNDHLIVRTSWLHGEHGPNFINTILRIAKEKDKLKIVNDQIGSPTWTGWLSQVLYDLISNEIVGVFHASSKGDISWMEFAKEIVLQGGLKTEIESQTTAELNLAAPRPAYSTLDVSKLEERIGYPAMAWETGVAEHLQRILK